MKKLMSSAGCSARRAVACVVVSAVTFYAALSAAEIPQTVHYQGYLSNAVGDPVHCPDALSCSASYTLDFRLYAQEGGGSALWEASFSAVPINFGVFAVPLGPFAPGDMDGARWLGIEVNGNGEMTPRQELRAAPYALHAQSAEAADDAVTLGGVAASAYVEETEIGGLCVTDDELAAFGYMTPVGVGSYLTENGYVSGAHFSGNYNDLDYVPPVLDQLHMDGAGNLTFGGNALVSPTGAWVGDPSGLVGPPGEDGAPGGQGLPGEQGPPGEQGSPGGGASLIVVLNADANLTKYKCETVDLEDICGDIDGCRVRLMMQHKTDGSDQFRTIVEWIGMEIPSESPNNHSGVYGWTRQGGGGDHSWISGTGNYTLFKPWDWAWMFTYTHSYCGTVTTLPTYHFQLMTHPHVRTRAIFYD